MSTRDTVSLPVCLGGFPCGRRLDIEQLEDPLLTRSQEQHESPEKQMKSSESCSQFSTFINYFLKDEVDQQKVLPAVENV